MYNKDVGDTLYCNNKQCNKMEKANNKMHFFLVGMSSELIDMYGRAVRRSENPGVPVVIRWAQSVPPG